MRVINRLVKFGNEKELVSLHWGMILNNEY